MSQGKPWDKEKVIEALMPYFKLDYTVNKACEIIGISQSTVQTWIDSDEALRLKIQAWRAEPSIQARKNWIEAMEKGRTTSSGPDKYTPAKEWLERRDDEFSPKTKTDITTAGEPISVLPPHLAAVITKAEDELKKSL